MTLPESPADESPARASWARAVVSNLTSLTAAVPAAAVLARIPGVNPGANKAWRTGDDGAAAWLDTVDGAPLTGDAPQDVGDAAPAAGDATAAARGNHVHQLTQAVRSILGRVPAAPPAAADGQNKVWKTDNMGVPGWREDEAAAAPDAALTTDAPQPVGQGAANVGGAGTAARGNHVHQLTQAVRTILGRVPVTPPAAAAGQHKVWKTDNMGVPGWREDDTGAAVETITFTVARPTASQDYAAGGVPPLLVFNSYTDANNAIAALDGGIGDHAACWVQIASGRIIKAHTFIHDGNAWYEAAASKNYTAGAFIAAQRASDDFYTSPLAGGDADVRFEDFDRPTSPPLPNIDQHMFDATGITTWYVPGNLQFAEPLREGDVLLIQASPQAHLEQWYDEPVLRVQDRDNQFLDAGDTELKNDGHPAFYAIPITRTAVNSRVKLQLTMRVRTLPANPYFTFILYNAGAFRTSTPSAAIAAAAAETWLENRFQLLSELQGGQVILPYAANREFGAGQYLGVGLNLYQATQDFTVPDPAPPIGDVLQVSLVGVDPRVAANVAGLGLLSDRLDAAELNITNIGDRVHVLETEPAPESDATLTEGISGGRYWLQVDSTRVLLPNTHIDGDGNGALGLMRPAQTEKLERLLELDPLVTAINALTGDRRVSWQALRNAPPPGGLHIRGRWVNGLVAMPGDFYVDRAVAAVCLNQTSIGPGDPSNADWEIMFTMAVRGTYDGILQWTLEAHDAQPRWEDYRDDEDQFVHNRHAWDLTAGMYWRGNSVHRLGNRYFCILDHEPSANNRPGDGTGNWGLYWER